jgi:dTDP-4-dehydrorhamnose 3,5-epimerase-like enzyme
VQGSEYASSDNADDGLMIVRLGELRDSRGSFLEIQKNSVMEAAMGSVAQIAKGIHLVNPAW